MPVRHSQQQQPVCHLAEPACRSCRAGCCCCVAGAREPPGWVPPMAPSSICWYRQNISREPRKKGRTAGIGVEQVGAISMRMLVDGGRHAWG